MLQLHDVIAVPLIVVYKELMMYQASVTWPNGTRFLHEQILYCGFLNSNSEKVQTLESKQMKESILTFLTSSMATDSKMHQKYEVIFVAMQILHIYKSFCTSKHCVTFLTE